LRVFESGQALSRACLTPGFAPSARPTGDAMARGGRNRSRKFWISKFFPNISKLLQALPKFRFQIYSIYQSVNYKKLELDLIKPRPEQALKNLSPITPLALPMRQRQTACNGNAVVSRKCFCKTEHRGIEAVARDPVVAFFTEHVTKRSPPSAVA
jgi:hypothetical protein